MDSRQALLIILQLDQSPSFSMNRATIHRDTLQANQAGFLRYLQQRDKLALLPQVLALAAEQLPQHQERIPLLQLRRFYDQVAALTGDPLFGMENTRCIELDQLPMLTTLRLALDQAGIQRPPLALTLRLLARYLQIITEVVRCTVIPGNASLRLQLHPFHPDAVSLHQIEGATTGILRIVEAFNDVQPRAIYLPHARDAEQCAYLASIWGAPVHAGSDRCELYFQLPPATPSAPLETLLPPLQKLLDESFPERSLLERCQHLLATSLGLGEPRRDTLAAALGISVSTLQRRLTEVGTSFGAELEQVRKQQAQLLLQRNSLSTRDAAFLLGFQSSSQFFKAFKQWFDQTPAEYRARRQPS